MVRRMRIIAGLLLLAAVGAGCVDPLPSYREVDRLRILAIRAEPPELLTGPVPSEVRFEALVVDAQNRPIQATWQFCPVESGRACLDYEDRLEQTHDNIEQVLGVLPDSGMSGAGGGGLGAGGAGGSFGGGGAGGAPMGFDCPLSPASAQGLGALLRILGSIPQPNYITERFREPTVQGGVTTQFVLSSVGTGDVELTRLDLGFFPLLAQELAACDPSLVPESFDPSTLPEDLTDLHLYHFLAAPLDSLVGVWPSAVLTVKAGEDSLTAFKRLPLSFRQPAGPLALVQFFAPSVDLGVTVCGPNQPPSERFPCLPVSDREPNTNPVFQDVLYAPGESPLDPNNTSQLTSLRVSSEPFQLAPLRIQAGTSVRILPVFTAESYETYQTLNVSVDTQELQVRVETEKLAVSWFVSSPPELDPPCRTYTEAEACLAAGCGWDEEECRADGYGRLQDARTWPDFTRTLDTTYTAPARVPARQVLPDPNDPTVTPQWPAKIWMVTRDLRGGVTWAELPVEITPVPVAVP